MSESLIDPVHVDSVATFGDSIPTACYRLIVTLEEVCAKRANSEDKKYTKLFRTVGTLQANISTMRQLVAQAEELIAINPKAADRYRDQIGVLIAEHFEACKRPEPSDQIAT